MPTADPTYCEGCKCSTCECCCICGEVDACYMEECDHFSPHKERVYSPLRDSFVLIDE